LGFHRGSTRIKMEAVKPALETTPKKKYRRLTSAHVVWNFFFYYPPSLPTCHRDCRRQAVAIRIGDGNMKRKCLKSFDSVKKKKKRGAEPGNTRWLQR